VAARARSSQRPDNAMFMAVPVVNGAPRGGDFGGTAGDGPLQNLRCGGRRGLYRSPIFHKLPLYFPQFSGLLFTMTQQNINSLAVSHIHQEALDLNDVGALMEEFVLRKETRASMFGK
jgi:hypothetical protein